MTKPAPRSSQAARAASYHPAVALLTAFPVADEDWQEMGADKMLVKPMHTEVLLEQIENLFTSHEAKLAKLGKSVASAAPDQPTAKSATKPAATKLAAKKAAKRSAAKKPQLNPPRTASPQSRSRAQKSNRKEIRQPSQPPKKPPQNSRKEETEEKIAAPVQPRRLSSMCVP